MDKYEYKVRSEEISKLIEKEKYADAVKIADTIDWRRVKSAAMLLKIAALYRISRRNEDSREMLLLAYERYPTNRSVVYSLCELSIELDDVVAAIEYYKRFAKLAPKDNGVYTLRYRILEAQEASLEERIEILEELKKKDYQEEWAYELAYLYHRVGLSTKCVEECDDIILWFGDGPYVMKAMELKAKHVPLTAMQQQNYDIMLGNAGQNYSSVNYDTGDYSGQDYSTEGYDGQNYDAQGYAEQSYDAEGYTGQDYNTEGYAGQDYNTEGYDGQNYDTGNYDAQNYNEGNYDTQGYDTVNYNGQGYSDSNETYENGYDQEGYAEESYGNDYNQEGYMNESYGNGYSQEGYAGASYGDGYGQEIYPDGQYMEEDYSQQSYSGEQYADDNYAQNHLVDDGYGNLSYVDGPYQDNGYTGAFYVEQTYDENGNLITPETYADNDYLQGRGTQEYNYEEQADAPKQYRNGLHLVENTAAPAGNSGDMSQYNTINLQKVVAESMKELFPDDNDDVFAEDREKYNSGEEIKGVIGDTRIFAGITNPDTAKKRGDSSGIQTQAGRVHIAQMVTGVLETAPEPHTGAIKKVLVPGEDARLIKSDSDIEELRDTTEKSVDDEHIRMEYNDENVYHEQSIIGTGETDVTPQKTGPMKLDEVLVEWERMKQDNARKHQEELKKRVLSQTGKIFADFDNSIKSGILGELEREEEEAQRKNQISSAKKGNDGFLDADVTGDILQRSVSDDDFDVAYATDHKLSKQVQESDKADKDAEFIESEQSEKSESDMREVYPAETEQPVLQEPEFATEETYSEKTEDDNASIYIQDLPEESTADYESGEYSEGMYQEEAVTEDDMADIPVQETDESVSAADSVIDEQEMPEETVPADDKVDIYTQKIPIEGVESFDTEKTYEESQDEYVEESYAETEEGYIEVGEFAEQTGTEDIGEENTKELYAKDIREYTGAVYAENDRGYTEDVYAEDDREYTGEIYTEDAGEYTEEIFVEDNDTQYTDENGYHQEDNSEYADTSYTDDSYIGESYTEESNDDLEDAYSEPIDDSHYTDRRRNYQYSTGDLDPEDAESIAEMAKEDALKTQEIKMNTADLSSLSEKIVATTKKEARGAKREEVRDFTPDEQTLFENFAVTKKIKKQIIYALDHMTLAAYTGNVIITGDAGLDTIRMAKNLIKEYQALDESFSGKLAKITGEKINQRNIKDVFEKLHNGGIIIEKANGMSEEKLYELATNLNQDTLGIVVIMEDTKKEITKLLEKQAMIVDYFNIRIDLMEMDNNALVAYAKNYALALEYSIDELGTLALYTRIANMQSGNHVVTKDEVRDIIDEAIWKSKKSKIKNFVDVLFARRYDNEDMIVLKERDFM
ncbi:MAG: hypothetical protein K2N44_04470 [Lachnospiraceae bacterium]|nr:hypothetical protein [Lachnospiraceae bacterium]